MTSIDLWDVFISYGTPDRAVADELHSALTRHPMRVFLDYRVLRPGDDWDEYTPRAVQNSRVIVVLCSPYLMEANYARSEILQAIKAAKSFPNGPRVIPVIVAGGAEDLPFGLERKQSLDFTKLGAEAVAREILAVLIRDRDVPPAPAPATKPNYPDPHMRGVAEALGRARERYKKLVSSKAAPPAVLAEAEGEIAKLRKQLRTGGQLRPGDVLSDKYLLLDRLGRGGFATVWL